MLSCQLLLSSLGGISRASSIVQELFYPLPSVFLLPNSIVNALSQEFSAPPLPTLPDADIIVFDDLVWCCIGIEEVSRTKVEVEAVVFFFVSVRISVFASFQLNYRSCTSPLKEFAWIRLFPNSIVSALS